MLADHLPPQMNARTRARLALMLSGLACSLLVRSGDAAPVGSAFSYQGRLLETGAPATGRYDLQFSLFNTETAGNPSGASLTNAEVLVANGLFNAMLDFGTNVFSGATCWLEIGIRPAGSQASFTLLSPRQLLTPAPYAVYTLKAESLIGPVPDSQLSSNVARLDGNQTFRGAVRFSGNVSIGASNAAASLDVQGNVRAASFSGN